MTNYFIFYQKNSSCCNHLALEIFNDIFSSECIHNVSISDSDVVFKREVIL